MKPLSVDNVADVILFSVTRAPHVNLDVIELMPEAQGFGLFLVKRGAP